jgi:hypothetical protein
MTDEDYTYFNSEEDDNYSLFTHGETYDDNDRDSMLSRFIGRYRFVAHTGRASIRWKYRSTKWHTKHLGYRLKNGSFPNPIEHKGNFTFKYGYLWSMWHEDEINFMPQFVSKMMYELMDERKKNV